jgi:hypothetical protein
MLSTSIMTAGDVLLQISLVSEPFLLAAFGALLILLGSFVRRLGGSAQPRTAHTSRVERLPGTAEETAFESSTVLRAGVPAERTMQSFDPSAFGQLWVPSVSSPENTESAAKTVN